MITLSTALILPSPLDETLVNATLAQAKIDLHNQTVELLYVYGNLIGASFAPSTNLPGIKVYIVLKTGAVYVRGDFKGWLQPATLATIQQVTRNFVRGSEALATGVIITLPNADGSQGTETVQVSLLPGTIS